MKQLIIISFFSLLSLFSFAQTKGITAKPDTNIILIGQQINVSVEVKAQEADIISLPLFLDSMASNVEIVRQTEWDTIDENGNYTFSKNVFITSWDSGYYPIPPIPAVINGDTFGTNAFLIGVATIPIDSTNAIADIKGIESDPLTWKDYFDAYGKYLLYIWLVALVITIISILILRSKKQPEQIIEVKPDIPAHIVAYGKLKALEQEQHWQNNRIKQFHVELSEIIREYIENRFEIQALEQTTEEIMHFLRLSELSETQKRSLRKLLMLTDLVKFAKEQPLAQENEEILASAFRFVEETKIKNVEPNHNTEA